MVLYQKLVLSNVMSSLVPIYKYGNGADLLNKPCIGMSELKMSQKREEYSMSMLAEDIKQYNYLPASNYFESGRIEVKCDFYRFVSIVLYDLKILTRIATLDTWDTVKSLAAIFKWPPTTVHVFNVLLAVSMHIRLSCYLFYNSQREVCSVCKPNYTSDKNLYYVDKKIFHIMAKYLTALKTSLTRACQMIINTPKLNRPITSSFFELMHLEILIDEDLATIMVHFYCMQWKECLDIIKNRLETTVDDIYLSMKSKVGKHNTELLSEIDLLASWQCGQYEESIKSGEQYLAALLCLYSKNSQLPAMVWTQGLLSLFYEVMGKLDEKSASIEKLLHIRKITSDNQNLSLIAEYHNVGNILLVKEKYHEAIQNYEKALQLSISLFGEDSTHLALASSHERIGCALCKIGQYDLSVQHLGKALQMKLSEYSENTVHYEIATTYKIIGESYRLSKIYGAAIEHVQKGLDMRLSLHGKKTPHHESVLCYKMLGGLYIDIEEYDKGLEYSKKTLEMRISLHGHNAIHIELADCYELIGVAYFNMGQLHNALKNLRKCFRIFMDLCKGDIQNDDLAKTFEIMLCLCRQIYIIALKKFLFCVSD